MSCFLWHDLRYTNFNVSTLAFTMANFTQNTAANMVTHTTIIRAIISFGLFAAPTVAAPAAVADPVALAAPAPLAEPATAAAAAGEYLGVNSHM